MNKIILVGRLTRDPELRTTPNGISVCSLSLAVSRRMDRDKTDFLISPYGDKQVKIALSISRKADRSL